MATRERRPAGASRQQARPRTQEKGLVPVLAKAVRDVELAVQRGKVGPTVRQTFQAIALLVREERGRIKTDRSLSESRRTEAMKRATAENIGK